VGDGRQCCKTCNGDKTNIELREKDRERERQRERRNSMNRNEMEQLWN